MVEGGIVMFLNQLIESNKEGFLKICVHAALANGVFAEEERDVLYAYCREMNVDIHIPETSETFEELLSELNNSATQKEKNIIVLETLALVEADGRYDEKEKEFMKKLINGLIVPESTLEKFIVLLEKYTEISKELYAAIVG